MCKIILFENKADCCGCGACVCVCPEHAITMKEDENGFLYPEIDDARCIGCGACNKVCAYQGNPVLNKPLSVKAVSNRDSSVLMRSSSGGVFYELARFVLSQQGKVYGAAYTKSDEGLSVEHIGVDRIDDLTRLQGSKYVQSQLGDTYNSIKREILSGKLVLFSGTPCQVAGLKSFLGREYDNLLTLDLVCHGVPNQRQFNEFIQFLSKKFHGKVVEFSFREKEHGWTDFYIEAIVENKYHLSKKYGYCKLFAYYTYFLESDIYRENCYSCKYATMKRCGDITLGDFWGFEQEHSSIRSEETWKQSLKTGISCVLLNTEKGKNLFCKVSSKFHVAESDFEKAAKVNKQLRKPSPASSRRDKILEMWQQEGYERVQVEYQKFLGKKYYKLMIRKMIAPVVKKILRH